MPIGGEVVEQTSQTEQVVFTSLVAQRRILFAQPAEPAEEVSVSAQLRYPPDLRKGRVEIDQKTVGHAAVLGDGVALQSEGESLNMRFENLIETGLGAAHEMWRVDKRVRFSTARAYSRQTSWGARWT